MCHIDQPTDRPARSNLPHPPTLCNMQSPNACSVDTDWADEKVDDAPAMTGCPGSLSASVPVCADAKAEDSCAAAGPQCAWCV
jgi:hypothetical protein